MCATVNACIYECESASTLVFMRLASSGCVGYPCFRAIGIGEWLHMALVVLELDAARLSCFVDLCSM